MSAEVPGKIAALVTDLFFAAKIGETAKQAGVEIEFAHSAEDLLSRARLRPSLIVLDLNARGLDAVAVIQRLKEDGQTAALPLVGFVRHEMAALIDSARQAGCEQVFSRNAFARRLPEILRGEKCRQDGSGGEC